MTANPVSEKEMNLQVQDNTDPQNYGNGLEKQALLKKKYVFSTIAVQLRRSFASYYIKYSYSISIWKETVWDIVI